MNPSLTGACFLLRSAWQAVYQPFLIHLRQLTSLRYGSLCSAVAALLVGLLANVLPAADGVANGAASPEILASDELALVRELATATLETCGVAPGAIARGKTNTLGFRAITPGGYPAIWIQDFTMNFSSGLIAREDGLRHLQLILEKQNGPEPKDLGQQVVISAHAIPDHINVDGAPVFFPGTYDPLANMNGDWGFRPPSNNQFDVIWLAHMLARSGDVKALLSREVGGRTVYERLKLAFAVPEINPATQLVRTTAERRAVGFIFYDAIEMTGDLLMASLIRYRAALHLAWLASKMDQPEDAKLYTDVAQQIRSHILPVFGDTDGTHGGWLKASNGISGQSDVWGSIYAIYIGAVEGEARAALLRTITAALAKPGEIEFEGALRHVPLSGDASPTTMWEKARHPKNRYMNGAYWHVPVGWLLTILQPGNPELEHTVKRHWLGHLRAQQGKVWECIGWDGQANKNESFGPSITLPLGVLSRGELRADRLLASPSELQAADAAASLPRGLPAAEGVDPAGIVKFLETMEARRFELHSFMLLRHGKVLAETWWAPYAPEIPHCLYSLSKSFTSTAVGLAAAEGRLSLDDKVISFFPESLPPQVSDHLAAMRVRDLLCMAAGHEKDPQNEMVKSDDWVRGFLAQPLVRAPGTQFVYSSAATYMCSAIVQKVTGMTVLAYLSPRLFEPLGMTGVTWDTCPRGINTGGWGLSVPTEGLAKFGQLYLQKGNWQGRQILPAGWVAEATSFQIQQPAKPGSTRAKEEDDQRQGYGFQFWRCRHNAVRGDGAFGQLIVMMPDQDAVVVMTSESRDMMEQLGLVWEYLLPAFGDTKLPNDDAAQEKLSSLLSTRQLAPRTGVAGVTNTSTSTGAQAFALEENSLGITRLTIANSGQTVTLTAKVGDTEHAIVHGLGEWHMGDTAMPGTPTRLGAGTLATPRRKVAASAVWLDASTLELTWLYREFPHRDTVTCRFDANRVTLDFLSSITVLGRGAPTRPTLTGRKLAP